LVTQLRRQLAGQLLGLFGNRLRRRACSSSMGTASVSGRRQAAVIAARETDCGRICSANSRNGWALSSALLSASSLSAY
jgi:hypothetical protein